ncbi:hypothetical protein LTR17_003208 [Elasticomyces elasticus]|nr:hypothetical protein LTR17_003208 [Elasticomyces elasticus]
MPLRGLIAREALRRKAETVVPLGTSQQLERCDSGEKLEAEGFLMHEIAPCGLQVPEAEQRRAEPRLDLYDPRAASYDESWHPRFARHMVELANLKAGEHVLDLACGTGLIAYPASAVVGSGGSVTGVDISSGMLRFSFQVTLVPSGLRCGPASASGTYRGFAEAKRAANESGAVRFYQHSITDLDGLPELEGKQFDATICASALVLLQDPSNAIRQWTRFLKPGGRLVMDVTHPASQISLITFERVGRALGRHLPFYRVPFQKPENLRALMEQAGLRDIEVILLSQMDIEGADALDAYRSERLRIETTYSIADADRLFDKHIEHWAASALASPDIREEARRLFEEEWTKLADADGLIEEVDGVYVGIGWKTK